jgi:hypothetical protein
MADSAASRGASFCSALTCVIARFSTREPRVRLFTSFYEESPLPEAYFIGHFFFFEFYR